MKVTERDEINRLRSLGYGYIKIAQQLGLSESSVKSFCRRHPLQDAESRSTQKARAPNAEQRWTADADSARTPVALRGGTPIGNIPTGKDKLTLSASIAGSHL